MSGDIALNEIEGKSLFVGELRAIGHFCSQNVLMWGYSKGSMGAESSDVFHKPDGN